MSIKTLKKTMITSLLMISPAMAQAVTETGILSYSIDNLVLLFCAVLVIFMQAGFAALESGMSPLNNTVNIMFKNFTDLCVGVLLFYLVGYSIMYGADASGGAGLFGWGGFGIASELSGEAGAGVLHPQVDWLFQVAFAATAATIVSGAVVGRMQFRAYVVYSLFITGIVYPVSGFWKWGGGWLDQLGFYDFAGSIVVHAVGGFAALAAAMVLGPRIGRFSKNTGKDIGARHLQGHSLALAASGVLILWVGWFGFNPGSQLAFTGEANVHATMTIAVNTMLAAGAGGVASMIVASMIDGSHKLSLSMLFNGVVAGLVGITANCDSVTNPEAIVIGLVAGVLVVMGVRLLERFKIDDVVGAWPAHGLCGVWGGIATGIFGDHDLMIQILGSVVIPAWAFITMFILFTILKKTGMLRVSREHEIEGLDLSEHGEIEGESY